MNNIIKYILLFIVLFITGLMIYNFKRFEYVFKLNETLYISAAVFTAGVFINRKFSERLLFWKTLNHELTHIFFSLIFGNKITGLHATEEDGGLARYQGRSNFVITLAPYFFPLVPFVLILFSIIIRPEIAHYFRFIIIFVYALSLCSQIEDFRYEQSDIKEEGKIFSTLFIVVMNVQSLLFFAAYGNNRTDSYQHTIMTLLSELIHYVKVIF